MISPHFFFSTFIIFDLFLYLSPSTVDGCWLGMAVISSVETSTSDKSIVAFQKDRYEYPLYLCILSHIFRFRTCSISHILKLLNSSAMSLSKRCPAMTGMISNQNWSIFTFYFRNSKIC